MEKDVNVSINEYLSKTDNLLDTHAPPKKLNEKELKSHQTMDYKRFSKLY